MTPLARSPFARATWLVLAPHPDDETLGAGALIAEAAAARRLGAVVYLTDGGGSHPAGTPGLIAARRREARAALRLLTHRRTPPIVELGWRDAAPHPPSSVGFVAAAGRLARLAERLAIDALATTGADEAHCDHAACAALAIAAARRARRPIAVFFYPVWPTGRAAGAAYRTAPMPPGRRRRALQAHRSQLGPVHGEGFRLPPERLRMPARDTLHRR